MVSRLVSPYQGSPRVPRSPAHSWRVRHTPFELTPIVIAPVLPGETLKNLLWQSRCVSKPIKDPLTGWWLEYWWFYVKHRDLSAREELTEMVLDPEKDMSSLSSAASAFTYHAGEGIDYTKLCVEQIVREYFRNEGEVDGSGLPLYKNAAGNYLTAVMKETWLDSLSLVGTGEVVDDPDVDLDADGTITASEVERARRLWEFNRARGLTQMTYEDWLRTYGVKAPEMERSHRPELIRYSRDWAYPANTVEPTTGVPSSAMSWAIRERADKDRRFTEPGFVVGLTCARPKVYALEQEGAVAHWLDSAWTWLPAVLHGDTGVSLVRFAGGAGPLGAAFASDYVVDVRDLFLYGDQFVNFAVTAGSASHLGVVTATGEHGYAESATLLFVDTTSAGNYLEQDGIADFTILGHQTDMSPTGVAAQTHG